MPRVASVADAVRAAMRSGSWLDLTLAALFTVGAQVELAQGGQVGAADLTHRLLLSAQTAPVAFMRAAPVTAASVSMAALGIEAVTVVPSNTLSALLAAFALLYTLGRRASGRRLVPLAVLIVGTLALHLVRRPDFGLSDLAFGLIFAGAAWLAGHYVRSREAERGRAAADAAAERTVAAAALDAAVADERSRIARELHDVIAHGMGVMVVQAAAAEQLLGSDPDAAREPLTTVRETGQDALAEMRRLLGLLRDGGTDESTAPQPGLAQLPALTARLRDAGMPITMAVTGVPPVTTAGLQLCAYRIVQEALTNSLKHSGGAATTLTVDYRPDAVALCIHNMPGEPALVSVGEGPGHGLVGMRERARLYGGTVAAGIQDDGSFRVTAVLPVR